ncbi:sucrase ferredoxin, partial [filamentous cyanobacterium CCP1]
EQLRRDYAGDALRVWRCSHFGGHNFAPTLVDLPTGQYWGHLDSEILDTLVRRQGDVSTIYNYYRGWSGLQRFEQMVEREIWMERGWDWLHYRKVGRTIAIDNTHEDEWDADWATIQIDFQSPNQEITGRYEARVETSGSVLTQYRSGSNEKLDPVKQYRVTSLMLYQS